MQRHKCGFNAVLRCNSLRVNLRYQQKVTLEDQELFSVKFRFELLKTGTVGIESYQPFAKKRYGCFSFILLSGKLKQFAKISEFRLSGHGNVTDDFPKI